MAPSESASATAWLMRIVRSLMLICASITVALALGEGALRLFPSLLPEDVQLRLLWNTRADPEMIADPYLGFRFPPNRTLVQKTRDFTMTIHTDEHGLRNKSPWPSRAPIVVLGDSLAFGYGVAEEQGWTRLLEARVQPDRIVNLSLPGFAPQQYFRHFEKLGASLQPELVIMCIFPGNDVLDARRFEVWRAAGSPGNFAAWGFDEMSDLGRASAPLKAPSFLESSRLAMMLTRARYRLRGQLQPETLAFPQGRVQLVPSVYEKRMSTFNAGDFGFRALVESVHSTRTLADRIGARLLVVLFPTKEEVYLPGRGAEYPHMVEIVHRALDELGVDTLDLTDELRQHANDARPVFFEVDGHPNELGNAVVADAVFRRLQQQHSEILTSEGAQPATAAGSE